MVNGLSEIEGFTPEQLRAFSTRRAEILEAAGEGASARAMQVATLATRETKDRDVTTESLREVWRRKGEEVGLDREAIRSTLGQERQAPEGRVAIAEIETALTAHASHFDRRDAIRAVANSLSAGAPGPEVVELADAYLATPGVVRIAETPRGDRYTTRAIWELEQKALASAEAMASANDRAVVDELIVARVLAQRPSIKPDQEAMVRRLLTGDKMLAEELAASTIRNTVNPLQAIFRHAVRRELAPLNPTRDLELPAARGRRDRIASAVEASRLIEALPPEDQGLWATAFYAGLRRGELQALRGSDIDLKRSEIHVQRSWDQEEGPIAPKSKAGTRTVPLLAVLRPYLKEAALKPGLAFGRGPDQPFDPKTVGDRAKRSWTQANERDARRATCTKRFDP